MVMDVKKIREDFPRLQKGDGLIYFDNASTSLKPRQVIDAVVNYYTDVAGNTGRGSHRSSQKATMLVEEARGDVSKLIGIKPTELAFTRNTTEGINAIAVSLERMGHFHEGDEIIVSAMEHHANLIPWQELAKRTGAKLKIAPLKEDYTLDMQALEGMAGKRTKLVSMCHASNTVATIIPAQEVAKIARDAGALFLLDGAQSVPDFEVNPKKIGCDFLVFSGHKMLGPTGVGAMYAKPELMEKMPPYNYGGGIVKKVTYEKTVYETGPQKFEAGTLAIAQIIGFGEAARYLRRVELGNVHAHAKKLLSHALQKLGEIDGIKIYGPQNPEKQRSIALFECVGMDPVDLAIGLDESKNIAIRSGLHCAEPIVASINPKGLDRASFYLYNTIDEINIFAEEVKSITKAFR
ncbi:MAG: cysteine desulfurase [archaeon]|nr:cysteine desulfurase [archaeon]